MSALALITLMAAAFAAVPEAAAAGHHEPISTDAALFCGALSIALFLASRVI